MNTNSYFKLKEENIKLYEKHQYVRFVVMNYACLYKFDFMQKDDIQAFRNAHAKFQTFQLLNFLFYAVAFKKLSNVYLEPKLLAYFQNKNKFVKSLNIFAVLGFSHLMATNVTHFALYDQIEIKDQIALKYSPEDDEVNKIMNFAYRNKELNDDKKKL